VNLAKAEFKFSLYGIVCGDIDTILAGKPRNFEAFVRDLENAGYDAASFRSVRLIGRPSGKGMQA